MRGLHDLMQPHVVGPMGEHVPYTKLAFQQAFRESIDGPGGLLEHVRSRHEVVEAALADHWA